MDGCPGSGSRRQCGVNMREKSYQIRKIKSLALGVIFIATAVIVLVPLFSILAQLLSQGLSSVNLDFFTHLPKPVGEPGGGMANAIVGTLILVGIASCIGLPIGIGTGIYLSEYSNKQFAWAIRFITDIMSGIPSIVYGIFVYILIVARMKTFSALAGGIALGVMMIPVIVRTTEEVLRLVPNSLREAALALGIPKWRTTLSIVLKTAASGVLTGVIVSLSRVAGETAPLLFTALGNHYWNRGLLEPIAALPLQVFTYAISPFDDWHRQAWAGALVLISLVFLTNILARLVIAKKFAVSA